MGFRERLELSTPTNTTGKKAGIREDAGNVTPHCDNPVTSLPVLTHVPRLGKGPHIHSPGSPRTRSRQCLALPSKGLENFADRCKRRSAPLTFSRVKHSSPSGTAGKSTLLQILAGKKLIKGADVTIKGLDVFYQFPEGVTFLGTEWSVTQPINPVRLDTPSHPFPGL